jgi:hypothetical protein
MRLKMSKQSRQELIRSLQSEYCKAGRDKKSEILRTIILATGFSQKHAIAILNKKQTKTPFRRIVESERVNDSSKRALNETYNLLDPVTLLSKIQEIQNELAQQETNNSGSLQQLKKTTKSQRKNKTEKTRSTKLSATQAIQRLPAGTVVRVADLLQDHTRSALDTAFNRLKKANAVTRIGYGIYQINQKRNLLIKSKNLDEATIH